MMRHFGYFINQAATKLGIHSDQVRLRSHGNVLGSFDDLHVTLRQHQLLDDEKTDISGNRFLLKREISFGLEVRTGSEFGLPHPVIYWNTAHHFSLSPFPGCCGLVVSHGVYTSPRYRNRGLNKLFLQFREELARALGYSKIVCTDVANNEYEVKTLNSRNFTTVDTFKNTRTGNIVNVSTKVV